MRQRSRARTRTILTLATLALATSAGAAPQSPLEDANRPDADRVRDAGSKPLEVYAWIGIEPGMTVADVIPSAGYNSHILAHVVGDDGKVLAAYTNEQGVAGLAERFSTAGLANATPLRSLAEVPDDTVDAAVVVRNLHDMFIPEVVERYGMDPNAILGDVLRTLKPGGLLGIVDGRATDGIDMANHRISEAMVIEQLEARGFEYVDRSDLLANSEDDRSTARWNDRWSIDRLLLKFQKPAN